MSVVRVELWSDPACPWCFIGKRRLDRAILARAAKGTVEVVMRSLPMRGTHAVTNEARRKRDARIASVHGPSHALAARLIGNAIEEGQAEGITFAFERACTNDTFDAHRLLHFAREHAPEKQRALAEQLHRACLCEGRAIDGHDVLRELAREAGLERHEVDAVLDSDRYGASVRADIEASRRDAIFGVPCFVFDARMTISGAQPEAILVKAIDKCRESRDGENESAELAEEIASSADRCVVD